MPQSLTEDAALRRKAKNMAVICALLGPMLTMSGLVTVGAAVLLEHLERRGAPVPNAPEVAFILDFAHRSAWVMVPLGVWLGVAGFAMARAPATHRLSLIRAGWATISGMFVLAAIWSHAVATSGAPPSLHFAGVAVHLLQAWFVFRGCRFLQEPAVVRACDASGPSASTT